MGETFIVLTIITTIAILLNVLFVGVISSLLSLLFDGYTASLFLLLPYMFGSTILAFLNSSEGTISIFNIIFPLSQIHDIVTSVFSNSSTFDGNSLLILPLLLVVVIFSARLFNRKWL